MGAPLDTQATTPMGGAWPPDHCPSQTNERKADCADPVHETAGRAGQQILMKIDFREAPRESDQGRPINDD